MPKYSDEVIHQIWERGITVSGVDPALWRKDYVGAWIRRDMYGQEGAYGWQIDHLCPVSQGGTDDISNLYPLHWRNNISKSDSYPDFTSVVTSSGNTNIESHQRWRINKK